MKGIIVAVLGIIGFLFIVAVPESGDPQFAWKMLWSSAVGFALCYASYKLMIKWNIDNVNEAEDVA